MSKFNVALLQAPPITKEKYEEIFSFNWISYDTILFNISKLEK